MKPIYATPEVERRVKRMLSKERKCVLEYARSEVVSKFGPVPTADMSFAVTERHLAECGFSRAGKVQPDSVLLSFQKFVHKQGINIPGDAKRLKGHDWFIMFQAGWRAAEEVLKH